MLSAESSKTFKGFEKWETGYIDSDKEWDFCLVFICLFVFADNHLRWYLGMEWLQKAENGVYKC